MQVVGYETADGGAGVYVASSDGVDFEPFEPGRELSWSLGERQCAGVVTEDGHRSCSAPEAPYCDHHTSTWVCARCTGDCLKDEMDCYDDHAVYLAAFAPDVFKVGVTKLWRLETRLREQGADRAAHLRTVENGRIAREIEAGLATELTDRVRVPTKVAGLGRAVDEAAWESTLAEFDPLETYTFDYGLSLSGQPVAETLVSGTVRGGQGRVVVVENAGTAYAVDLRDLVGYELHEDDPDRELQSSLGAFG
ncbi:DUF2797 domain-containing protein [Halobaculum sp. MBLA0147]|uniref:DUF2797 domain-containing protein n=1 Tax=Halobaculum sp. MBLA0147 TaxID=3079934 RepID=UPI0035246327